MVYVYKSLFFFKKKNDIIDFSALDSVLFANGKVHNLPSASCQFSYLLKAQNSKHCHMVNETALGMSKQFQIMPFWDRFLTFRLVQKRSAGSRRLGISFQNKPQFLQTALFDMYLISSFRIFMIDRSNTTILNLNCFVSFSSVSDPMWNLSLLGSIYEGICLATRDP